MVTLAACSKSFVVTSEVPRPLVEPINLSAKVQYSDEFKNFAYLETSSDRALEKVDFGSAQVGLFDQIFGQILDLVPDSATEYDLKIQPEILDFQYSIPSETKLNVYEIWVKYRLQISDSQENELADWVVKGYGKTPGSTMGSALKSFNTASNIALRDVGAQLAIGFAKQQSIQDYIAGKTNPRLVELPSSVDDQIAQEESADSQVEQEVPNE